MTPEGKVKQCVKKILDCYKPGCWYFMPSARAYGQAGVPDFIGVFHHRMFAIETKAGNNKPTPLQVLQMQKIETAGGTVFTIRENTVYQIADWLRYIQHDWIKADMMMRKCKAIVEAQKHGMSEGSR